MSKELLTKLNEDLKLAGYKNHPSKVLTHIILRFGSKTDAFMLYISKYYKQGH